MRNCDEHDHCYVVHDENDPEECPVCKELEDLRGRILTLEEQLEDKADIALAEQRLADGRTEPYEPTGQGEQS